MNRRKFVASGIAAGLSTAMTNAVPVGEKPHGTGPDSSSNRVSSWFSSEPLVVAGCWDDFPLFQRRLGGSPLWIDDLYRAQSSTSTLENLRRAGVTIGIIHFYKGFGLAAEREHMAQAQVLAKRMKEIGIRVGVYIGSTVAYETLLVERPEAKEWLVPDFMGRPVYYGEQTFRRRVYMMHPGYREYIRQVIRYAIEEFHADLLHFDNTSQQAHPAVFQHPLAVEDFRKYLAGKYTPQEMRRRLGIDDVRYVLPPQIDYEPNIINDPLFQEWAAFRNHQLVTYYRDMRQFAISLDPSVVIINNPSSGFGARNLLWDEGMNYDELLGVVDGAWTEEGTGTGVDAQGILISKIRTLKVASKLQKTIFSYTWGASGNWGFASNSGSLLQMAESMAYNHNCLGMVGNFNAIGELPAEVLDYIRFFHAHFELFQNATPVADVALLYSTPSMAFSGDRPAASFMYVSQTLIQEQIPFDIIFDRDLADLSKYRALFLADQECLSDKQVEAIRQYVLNGGVLVATGNTSLYNERRERRLDYGLADLFRVKAPSWRGAGRPEIGTDEAMADGDEITENKLARGRVIYLPAAYQPGDLDHQTSVRTRRAWPLSGNNRILRKAVYSALNGAPTIQIQGIGARYVTVELRAQPSKERWILHTLNYDFRRASEIKNLSVRLRMPEGKQARSVQALSPDRRAAATTLPWNGSREVAFVLPTLKIHTMSVIEMVSV